MAEWIVEIGDGSPHIKKMIPLVRCKDCKHGSPNEKYGCKCYHYKRYEVHEMNPNDFCSRAERRAE